MPSWQLKSYVRVLRGAFATSKDFRQSSCAAKRLEMTIIPLMYRVKGNPWPTSKSDKGPSQKLKASEVKGAFSPSRRTLQTNSTVIWKAIAMLEDKVTLCLTIGRRPDLLRLTLESLNSLPSIPILAINDFGDEETNVVFREKCPQGLLIEPGRHLGHHSAVDLMYSYVITPYIFHCEDDWLFSRTDFLSSAMRVLDSDPQVSSVHFRATDDIPLQDTERKRIFVDARDGVSIEILTEVHAQWYGYSFNPHLARKLLWQEVGKFSKFKKERHISRFLRKQERYMAFLAPEACRHIGNDHSTNKHKIRLTKRFKRWLRQAVS